MANVLLLVYVISAYSASSFYTFYAFFRCGNNVSVMENPQKSQNLPQPILHQRNLGGFAFGWHNIHVSHSTFRNMTILISNTLLTVIDVCRQHTFMATTKLSFLVKNLVLGEKLFEGRGKSGPGFIEKVGMEGIAQMYSWAASVKGLGKAAGVECMLSVTAKGITPPKGVGTAKDQGVFRTSTGEMGVLKGNDIAKMDKDKIISVGLWSFMTASEKLGWMNDIIALVEFQALDPMWQDFNITIYEWT